MSTADAEPVSDCYACGQQGEAAELPPREDVIHTEHWRVAHAFNSTLPGWLVLVPAGHVTAFTQLTAGAAAELGTLIRELSLALEAVTGCVKTYVMQFAEAEGFAHLHVHVVPRAADHPDDAKGARVFSYLTDDEARWLPAEARDDVALRLRVALGGESARLPVG